MIRHGSMKRHAIAAAVAACFASNAQANPAGPSVAAGSASFSTSGSTLTVTNSPGAIINWQQFNIQKDEVTRFVQQNAASAVLNRVVGQDPSVILGQLHSNGRVFLINPSGIAFGQGAVVNVAGLVASTLNISDGDFLTGRLRFVGSGGEGAIANAGEIRTPAGGHVYLVAPKVENQPGGVITSPNGDIVIAAGRTVELVSAFAPDIRVEVTAPDDEAVNAGEIVAASGRVGVYGTLLRNSGLVSASRAEIGDGGRVFLRGTRVELAGPGRVEASGDLAGRVDVQADSVHVGENAEVAAISGTGSGGEVSITAMGPLQHDGTLSATGNVDLWTGGISEGPNGRIITGHLWTFGGGDQLLTGPNQVAAFTGSAGGNLALSNQGPLSVRNAIAGGSLTLDVDGTLTFQAGAAQFSGTTTGTGLSISATSLVLNAQDGGTVLLNDFTGPQSFAIGAGGIDIQAHGFGSIAQINQFGAAPQTLTVTDADRVAITAADGGGAGIFALSAPQSLSMSGAGANAIQLQGSGNGFAALVGFSQDVAARSLHLTTDSGGIANVAGQGAAQAITLVGGNLELLNGDGGFASVSAFGQGATQNIAVIDGDHININGWGSAAQASISAFGGASQVVSISGSGANEINVGSTGALGRSAIAAFGTPEVGAGSQSVTAGTQGQAGSITVIGSDLNNMQTAIITGAGAGAQTVSTTGAIRVLGGNAPGTTATSGVMHNGSGGQTVTARSIDVQGGSGGAGNAALIASFGGGVQANAGTQTIEVPESIRVRGGSGGRGNRAQLVSSVDQFILGNPDIEVRGGDGGGTAPQPNFANITAGVGRFQSIEAGTIVVAAGSGGTDNSASITGGTQFIHATGDVVVAGGGAAGNLSGARIGGNGGANPQATNLTLFVDGNLVLQGGSGNSGAALGSTPGTALPLASNITVNTNGSVVLNGGASGARIGYSLAGPAAGGDVSINAGGSIELDGASDIAAAAIRTLGNVSLFGDGIHEGPNGLIAAGALSAFGSSDILLTGPNQVGSFTGSGFNVSLVNHGDLSLGNVNAWGSLDLDVDGTLSIVSTGMQGAFVSSENGQNIRAGALAMRAVDGGFAMLTNNQGSQTIAVGPGGIDIEAAGSGSFAQIGQNGIGGQTITVNEADAVAIRAFGGGGAGIFALGAPQSLSVAGGANATRLEAEGAGSFAALVGLSQEIAAGSLRVTSSSGASANVAAQGGSQAIGLTGGNLDVVNNGPGGSASVTAFGVGASQGVTVVDGDAINVLGGGGQALIGAFNGANQVVSITGGGANAITVGSAGALGGSQIAVFGGPGIGAGSQSVTAGSAGESGSITLVGTAANGMLAAINTGTGGGSQAVSTSGAIRIQAGSAPGQAGSLPTGLLHNGAGLQTVTARSIELRGGPEGNGNFAAISSTGGGIQANAGNQVLNVSDGILLVAGSSGTANRAQISTSGNQTIVGGADITVVGGAGGGSTAAPNLASISSGVNRLQVIEADNITLAAGTGGIDNSASITGQTQRIDASGDVRISGGGAAGNLGGARIGGLGGANAGATNLTLTLDGDLVLTGGNGGANNGAGLGSTGLTAASLASNVAILAGGSVILEDGSASGTRIGYAGLAAPAAGEISIVAGGGIHLNGDAQTTAIRTLGNVTLTANGAAGITQASKGLMTGGSISAATPGSVVLDGASNAAGTFSLVAGALSGAGQVATGGGFIVDVSADSLLGGVISGAGGLSKNGAGTLTLGAVNTYSGDTNVNAGTLALAAADQTNSGTVNIASGAILRGSPGTFTNTGVIAGSGTLDVGATAFTNAGTLRPGGSGAIGTLTVAGNATLTGMSLIDVEARSAAEHDVLAITGASSLDGSLSLSLLEGYAPQGGETLVPLTFASRTGTAIVVQDTWFPAYHPTSLALVFDTAINRWVGADGDWSVASNWSRGHVPLRTETVLIDVPGRPLVTVSGGARVAGKLSVFDDFRISGGNLRIDGPSLFEGRLTMTGGALFGGGAITSTGGLSWSGGAIKGQLVTLGEVVRDRDGDE